ADKMRHVRFEVANRLIESLSRLCGFRRKELERKRGRISPHDIDNVHGLGAYLRSSRDFWSTHRKNIFSHIFGVKPHESGLGSLSPSSPDSSCRGLRSKQQHPVAIKFTAKSQTPALETPSHLLVLESSLSQLRRLRGVDRDW